MDKFSILLERLDELIAQTEKKFDLALARQATWPDDVDSECKEVVM